MGWFTDAISGGVSKLVKSTGEAIDSLVTSDEERLTLKNELNKQINEFKAKQMDHATDLEKEISKRHENDMKSDSWLSKNVRPLMLIFLTVMTVILAFTTTFTTLTELQVTTLKSWIPLLQTLLITAYTFYFGGRSYEKGRDLVKKLKGK